MVSALYVVWGVLLVMKFTLDVVRYRRQYRVAYGDGGINELKIAIRIHGNAIETLPLALLLLIVMEMNGANIWMIHLTALLFFTGRLVHAYGLRHSVMKGRQYGMMLTLFALCGMAIFNLIYLPWELVLTLH
ncbi:MAPEG family protein [Pantoea sp. LMR881]|uniref:MAPEG family protein n=1 Tax=Pantoea sp. LMR881 TaxID=3014336 RepID=UPI0022AF6711|nr:MAPEG family protein [Pantoea sp. LMR881]MCZ4058244.1 MAPEG family protein [Pantoea sp. LMR881]